MKTKIAKTEVEKKDELVAQAWLRHYEEEGRLQVLLDSGILTPSEVEKTEKLRKREENLMSAAGKKLTRLAFDKHIGPVIMQEYDEFMYNNSSTFNS